MNRPTQTVHILSGSTSYSFDSVIKMEHTHTMDMLEDSEETKGYNHVNYAVKKPSTIAMEVSVTDTVTIMDEPLTKGAATRSASAYATLYRLMQARGLLTIVTRMYTFSKMILSDFVITEDPDHQFEMYANVAFSEAYLVEKITEEEAAGKDSNGKKTGDIDEKPAPVTSLLYNISTSIFGDKKGASAAKGVTNIAKTVGNFFTNISKKKP